MARTAAARKSPALITNPAQVQASAPSELRDARGGKAALYDISQARDVKAAICALIGDLSGFMLAPTKVLVAHYIAPERTSGGIIKPDTNKKEDVWQGAVVLILKKGALAFQDDGRTKFGGFDPRVGEWVTITPAEGKRRQINGVDCRTIDDALIDMVVPDPATITHRT
jgi:co-chaperonin GroES (HSP10)